jgi:UDP-2,3-diacylglucosamine hydrolase
VLYAKDKLKEDHFDYFIFGHRHLPIDFQLNEVSRYINLGDWIKYNSYAEFDGTTVQLKYYQ